MYRKSAMETVVEGICRHSHSGKCGRICVKTVRGLSSTEESGRAQFKKRHGGGEPPAAGHVPKQKSDGAFISTQTRIGQIQVDIVKVMEECSQEQRLAMTPSSRQYVRNHDALY